MTEKVTTFRPPSIVVAFLVGVVVGVVVAAISFVAWNSGMPDVTAMRLGNHVGGPFRELFDTRRGPVKILQVEESTDQGIASLRVAVLARQGTRRSHRDYLEDIWRAIDEFQQSESLSPSQVWVGLYANTLEFAEGMEFARLVCHGGDEGPEFVDFVESVENRRDAFYRDLDRLRRLDGEPVSP